MICPRCRQDAPIVYRGLIPTCTACGAERPPLAAPSVNLAGKPAGVAGSVARVAGYLTIGVGLFTAAIVGGLLSLFPVGAAGIWIISGAIALAACVIGALMLRGGTALKANGAASALSVHRSAILSLARVRGGTLRAADVAQAIGVSTTVADDILTSLAKTESDAVKIELDDQGGLYYLFPGCLPPAPAFPMPPTRVASPQQTAPQAYGQQPYGADAWNPPADDETAEARARRMR